MVRPTLVLRSPAMGPAYPDRIGFTHRRSEPLIVVGADLCVGPLVEWTGRCIARWHAQDSPPPGLCFFIGGAYFVTISTNDRAQLLGEIGPAAAVVLSGAGNMVDRLVGASRPRVRVNQP